MKRQAMAAAVQNAARPRFRGGSALAPKTMPQYPHNLEREYARIVAAYMDTLGSIAARHLPEALRAVESARMRLDSPPDHAAVLASVSAAVERAFIRIMRDFGRRARAFGLEGRIARLAEQARRHSVAQWRNLVRSVLGISVLEDYYMGEFHRHALSGWAASNASLIKSAPAGAIGEMRNVLLDSWHRGLGTKDISKRLQRTFDANRKRADFRARDQMAKLNADLSEQQQKDAGVKEYVWRTAKDERVRGNPKGKWPNGRHYGFHGKRFNWAGPPEVAPGRHCHPGKDYRCRCVALPVFDLPGLVLPWEGADGE